MTRKDDQTSRTETTTIRRRIVLSFSRHHTRDPSVAQGLLEAPRSMGQRSSSSFLRPRLPLAWTLRGERLRQHRRQCGDFSESTGLTYERDNYLKENVTRLLPPPNGECDGQGRLRNNDVLHNAKYEEGKADGEEERFIENFSDKYRSREVDEIPIEKTRVEKALSAPSLFDGSSSTRKRHSVEGEKHGRRRTRRSRKVRNDSATTSGFLCGSSSNGTDRANTNLDAFLIEASIERPANIPVVLSFPSILYQTRSGGTQDEIALPLGTVVNAVFKNQSWLYVQTAHGQEGYVGYTACVPLGILPRTKRRGDPCWEDPTDVFPQPLGNSTDSELLKDTKFEYKSYRENVEPFAMPTVAVAAAAASAAASRIKQDWSDASLLTTRSDKGERNCDRFYLRTDANRCASHTSRHTSLISRSDLTVRDRRPLSISRRAIW